MAKRASDEAGVKRRVYAVSRFTNPRLVAELTEAGVEPISCDLLDESAVMSLPDAPSVIYMAGTKFGTTGQRPQTWAMNAYLPGVACRRYRGSRIVAFSSGNIYGLVPVASGGSKETDQLQPVGEYAWSVLGRERVFQYFCSANQTPGVLIRLNYACELRYGVLVDIAQKVFAGQPVSLGIGHLNTIWQQDANAMVLQALAQAAVPVRILNLTGPRPCGSGTWRSRWGSSWKTGQLRRRRIIPGPPERRIAGPAAVRAPARGRGADHGDGGGLGDARRRLPGQADALREQGREVLVHGNRRSQETARRGNGNPRASPCPHSGAEARRAPPARPDALLPRCRAGGLAVGVHTTQFAIRSAEHNLYRPVLALAAEEMAAFEKGARRRVLKIAGAIGPTAQAVKETETAASLGYDAVLLSLGWAKGRTAAELAAHCREVSKVLPLFGFYLQQAAGGIQLSAAFWRLFLEIESVAGIKVAPFNRYQTIDVARALAESGRHEEVVLYTGNDDSIISDLLTPYRYAVGGRIVEVRCRGGLLGHWAVGTRAAVQHPREDQGDRSFGRGGSAGNSGVGRRGHRRERRLLRCGQRLCRAALRASTRCWRARAFCWVDGAWTPPRTSPRGRPGRSTG